MRAWNLRGCLWTWPTQIRSENLGEMAWVSCEVQEGPREGVPQSIWSTPGASGVPPSIWSTPGASGVPLEYLEHPWNIWRKEQNTSQFGGVSLLFQGKKEDGNKRAVRELRGNQESVVMETEVAKETFKKLEQPPVFPTLKLLKSG